MSGPSVLVVEDDAGLRGVLARGLREEGFEVSAVERGGEAIRATTERRPDVMIIDIGLPDADGRDVCQALRAQGVRSPVLFLTARDAVSDRLAGFRAGGGGYLGQPPLFVEPAARVRALTPRRGPPADPGAGRRPLARPARALR